MTTSSSSSSSPAGSKGAGVPAVVSGVQLMQGIGHVPSKGFWPDAWSQVTKRKLAMAGLVWIGLMVFLACFGPLLASGHPLILWPIDENGVVGEAEHPWLWELSAVDATLLLFGMAAVPSLALGLIRRKWKPFLVCVAALGPAMLTMVLPTLLQTAIKPRELEGFFKWIRDATTAKESQAAHWTIGGIASVVAMGVAMLIPIGGGWRKLAIVAPACILGGCLVAATWVGSTKSEQFNYIGDEQLGYVKCVYTVIPFSPEQRFSALGREKPWSTLGGSGEVEEGKPGAGRRFYLGTDANGADVLSQLIHAARLAISIGVVSTGIALLIGVTMGALMGYFGGWMDLLLYRVVEIFMAVPVLFLLIVTVGILPSEWKNTYVIMAIVGCFTWTGMARFTRAEFLKLRNQDFVQSAKSVGLPLRSILFKHMLPNGVAPVLVDTSFAVAAAITFEAVLSYLGMGPMGQPSWGKLLSSAVSPEGEFAWWLAVFPGAAIFLTVLSYNLVGEALRDAIDPKLKKARV